VPHFGCFWKQWHEFQKCLPKKIIGLAHPLSRGYDAANETDPMDFACRNSVPCDSWHMALVGSATNH